MLFHIVNPKEERHFEKFMAGVKNAYWPEELYGKIADSLEKTSKGAAGKGDEEWVRGAVGFLQSLGGRKDELDKIAKLPTLLRAQQDPASDEDKRVKAIKAGVDAIVRAGGAADLYQVFGGSRARGFFAMRRVEPLPLPFVDHFHSMFQRRKYGHTPHGKIDARDLFALKALPDTSGNLSINLGNYDHFVNVVAAAARLVMYFREPANVKQLLQTDRKAAPGKTLREEARALVYGEPGVRTFKLMLAAFYHDIGKSVVDDRHGMEGSGLLSAYTTKALAEIAATGKRYFRYDWDREDLLEISNLLYYHDCFGMFGTGESSYTLLPEILDRFKRNSLRPSLRLPATTEPGERLSAERTRQIARSRAMLFDLWVLNIADIMVSSASLGMDKFEIQECWMNARDSRGVIGRFLAGDEGMDRIHDFGVAWRLLEKHNSSTHHDDISELQESAQDESRAHAIERIKRLVCASLSSAWSGYEKTAPDTAAVRKLFDYIPRNCRCDGRLADQSDQPDESGKSDQPARSVDPGVLHDIIFRSICSLNDPGEFYMRFSWIVSTDYALTFFRQIARRAIEVVNRELTDDERVSGWISLDKASPSGAPSDEQIRRANATFFLDNYCATVVRILAHLLFRERSIDQLSNIEFKDAGERLNDDKIDRIMGLEGPSRQGRSIELILKSVFVY